MAPKRHRLDINAVNAISVTVYQRSASGTRYLLKTCVCNKNQPAGGNWNCRPCRVRTRKKLDGRDASSPARVEIRVLFTHPINPAVPATQGLLGREGNPPVEKYYVTYLSSDQSREYRLDPADYVETPEAGVEPKTVAVAGLHTGRTLTQAKVPRAGDAPAFRTPTNMVGVFEPAAVLEPASVAPGAEAESMAEGSTVETADPGDAVVTGEQDQGLGEEVLYPVVGAAAGLTVAQFTRLTPLVGGLLGAVGGYFFGQGRK